MELLNTSTWGVSSLGKPTYKSNSDLLSESIRKLSRTKKLAEASIASDLDYAKNCYLCKRRDKALHAMRRAHRNKVKKECVATAIFQLIAMRIETKFLASDQDNGTTFAENQGNSLSTLSSEQDEMIERIISQIETFESSVPSDTVLMRKLARMSGVTKAR